MARQIPGRSAMISCYAAGISDGGIHYIDRCKAEPRGGDGSVECALEAFHKGFHKTKEGVIFHAVAPGTSPRSHARTRIRRREEAQKLKTR